MTICKACGHEAIGQHDCPEAAVARASHGADDMRDIEERLRLRDGVMFPDPYIFKDAKDEIERLRAIRDELLAFAQRVADNEGPWSGQAEAVIKKAKEQLKKDTTGM